MTTTPACESCGMPIETGRYCSHCTDEAGQLQSFDAAVRADDRLAGPAQPGTPRAEIERQTLELHGHHARLARPARVTKP